MGGLKSTTGFAIGAGGKAEFRIQGSYFLACGALILLVIHAPNCSRIGCFAFYVRHVSRLRNHVALPRHIALRIDTSTSSGPLAKASPS